MKIRKLPSGSWNAQVYDYTDEAGKVHLRSITAPTKAEVEYEAALFKKDKKQRTKLPSQLTVKQAIDKYIELSEVLSPTTLVSYRKIKEYAFGSIMDSPVEKLDDTVLQIAINEEARRMSERTHKVLSPKTVKNEWGLVAAALKTVCGKSYNIKLPKVQRTLEELPDPEQVLAAIKGTSIELPCLLAMWMSLRMSEVRGLHCSSIRNGFLFVDRVVVDVDGVPVEKTDAKTSASKRKIKIPEYVMQLIEQQESYKEYMEGGEDVYLIDMSRNQIHHAFTRIMEKEGIVISFHDLRHMFASISLNVLGLPPKVVQVAGGWSTPYVMDRIYSQSFSAVQAAADQKRDEYFQGML